MANDEVRSEPQPPDLEELLKRSVKAAQASETPQVTVPECPADTRTGSKKRRDDSLEQHMVESFEMAERVLERMGVSPADPSHPSMKLFIALKLADRLS